MKVNNDKTKVMVCKRKADVESDTMVKWPCVHCHKGVGANSIQCTECHDWVHKRCCAIAGSLVNFGHAFVCDVCAGTMVKVDKGNDVFRLTDGIKLGKVTSFTYLGDKIQANGGASMAIRARIRVAWLKWREIGALLVKKTIGLKSRANAYKVLCA